MSTSGSGSSSIPCAAATALPSATRPETSARRSGRSQTRPCVRPVSAPIGFDAALKTTLRHCGPRASSTACAGMPTHAVEDARGPQWRKVVFNAASNPIGALTGLTHGRVCERPDLRALVSGLVAEGKAVAAAQGIELDPDPEVLIDHAARPDVAYEHKASMLQDVEARRPTEIDYLNGGIVRFGNEHGVPTPLNQAIWALVKGVEQSWQQ